MLNMQQGNNTKENLALMVQAVKGVLEGETDLIVGLAQVSAVIGVYLNEVNWVGFYFLKGKELVLGPFQGLPACSRIGEGKGVCGRAVLEKETIVVGDVHAFPGHIACDSASASEIVIPLFKDGEVFGVLDIDSPVLNRFSDTEEDCLKQAGTIINEFLAGVK